MTRKDFQLIADAITETRALEPTGSPEAVLALITDIFADKLAGTNPAFDRDRFLTACGLKPIKVHHPIGGEW